MRMTPCGSPALVAPAAMRATEVLLGGTPVTGPGVGFVHPPTWPLPSWPSSLEPHAASAPFAIPAGGDCSKVCACILLPPA